jgi:lambda family phage portal protein
MATVATRVKKQTTVKRPTPAGVATVARPNAGFMRNEFLANWRPALREANDDVRSAWVTAASRTVDMIQNSGWIAGAVDQTIAYTTGAGLRLACKPDAAALGWTADEAQAWAQHVERRWEAWANRPIECDIEGKSSIGKMQAQALRSFFAYGEVLATLPYLRRAPGGQYGTKVQMLPPLRLVQDTATPSMVQGVIRDTTGYPLAYRIKAPPDSLTVPQYRDIPARDPFGRALVVHIFDGQPGQVRGIPPITPALRVWRQYDQLADATLTTSLIQTIFAATVKSPEPTEEILQAFQDLVEQQATKDGGGHIPTPFESMLLMRQGWYDQTQIDLGRHGKIAHLAPGDELTFHGSQHPNATYDTFAKFLLREIARCLGLTYEDFTGDYTQATYSSVRMATSAMWMITIYRRVNIIAPFLNPIFEAWLEEDIEHGWTPFPGGVDAFMANRAAAARTHWRGPAKPQADDLKFANAVKTLREMGVITDEWICAELGDDWEDVYEQRQREMQKRKALGLPDAAARPSPTPAPPTGLEDDPPADTADTPPNRTNTNG